MKTFDENIHTWMDELKEGFDTEAAEKSYDDSQDVAKSEYAKNILNTNKKLEETIASNKKELNRVALDKAIKSEEEREMGEQNNKGYLEFIQSMINLKKEESGNVEKTGSTSQYSSNYLTTEKVLSWVNTYPPKHDIAVTFPIKEEGAKTFLKMVVSHKSGYKEESQLEVANIEGVALGGKTCQMMATYFTYYKRQLASAYFCLNDSEDDDGNQIEIAQLRSKIKQNLLDEAIKKGPKNEVIRVTEFENLSTENKLKYAKGVENITDIKFLRATENKTRITALQKLKQIEDTKE